ncbi:hypothetical protein P12x_002628 [Tundrisphaera lichenicola]|uniref:hypothetical protein n=1 Tax=Tundrisphaera lichenicola TaxID=2029860 RepID=UPI003EB82C26
MSTAGKVLTVLILLVMIIWVVVLSGVTTLNVNWEQKIDKQEKQLQTLQADAEKAASDIIRLTEQARREQDATERDLAEVLVRIATAERRQSATVESLTRLKAEVADYTAAVERAEINKKNRDAEFAQVEEDVRKKLDEIAKSQTLNSDLRDQLAKLQDDFKKLMADNTAQVEQAVKAGRARPASSPRPAPAS